MGPGACPTSAARPCARRWKPSSRCVSMCAWSARGASCARCRPPATRSRQAPSRGSPWRRLEGAGDMAGAAMSELLAALPEKRGIGRPPRSVSSIAGGSRRVRPRAGFVAVPRLQQDGPRVLPAAVPRRARAGGMVGTEGGGVGELPVAQVLVPSVRVSLAQLAGAFYGHPSRQLSLVGITGTNGKTTTSYLVQALLRASGLVTGVIGTIGYVLGDDTLPANQTTPEAVALQSMVAQMRDRGVRGVAMEVSSHALALARADGIAFDVAVFTNLTQDHLDFHGTLENYRLAKRRLFELLAASPKP